MGAEAESKWCTEGELNRQTTEFEPKKAETERKGQEDLSFLVKCALNARPIPIPSLHPPAIESYGTESATKFTKNSAE